MTQTEVSLIDLSKSPYAKVKPLPIGTVTMHDGFWKPRMEANRAKAIPRLLELLEQHGRIENFRVARTRTTKERSELYCRDSDTYKWLEACALVLESGEDPDIRRMMDQVIDLVAGAQYDDGYLNTFYSGAKLPERFTNLLYHHELYSAGHLFQAAVAHHRATGSTKLLNVAIRFADLIVSQFGPGKIEQADGHPEAEMAFIELYRETGREEYLQLAKYFVDLQGFNDKAELSGHAVMAMYLAEGATDCYLETGDKQTWDALDRLWQDFVSNKMYVTGANGSRYKTEALGIAYELPNERAYAETCANAANGFWSWRMLAATGSCKYADMLERAFYNSFLSSWSLDGLGYFYCNPLANFTDYKRVEYFTVCCCPTNVVRTIAALPGYMYGADDDGVWIHLYDNSEVSGQLADGRGFNLIQSGRYPWDGTIEIGFEVDGELDSTLHLRIPSWCETAAVEVDGQTHPA
ncbi:MAG: beta-L-arabinofuranosidase domain-containing protein, partial [Armatimonadota bacterium]